VYEVGDYIGIKDDPEQDTWWLAEVTRVKGEWLHLAYLDTCGKHLPSSNRSLSRTKTSSRSEMNREPLDGLATSQSTAYQNAS
jgi:hypothetical protein